MISSKRFYVYSCALIFCTRRRRACLGPGAARRVLVRKANRLHDAGFLTRTRRAHLGRDKRDGAEYKYQCAGINIETF